MAVQQNKKSPSKRGMHRSHDHLSNPPLAVEPTTGRGAPEASHQPDRLLPRQEGPEDQGRISALPLGCATRRPRTIQQERASEVEDIRWT